MRSLFSDWKRIIMPPLPAKTSTIPIPSACTGTTRETTIPVLKRSRAPKPAKSSSPKLPRQRFTKCLNSRLLSFPPCWLNVTPGKPSSPLRSRRQNDWNHRAITPPSSLRFSRGASSFDPGSPGHLSRLIPLRSLLKIGINRAERNALFRLLRSTH